MAAFTKAHTTALCLIPPRKTWDSIQNTRCFNDRNFVRWFPHINLLYPFVSDNKDALQEAAQLVSQSLAAVQAFEMTLDEVSCFEHRDSCTIWLGSGQPQQLLDLQSSLQAAFPDYDELSLDPQRNIRGFRPHLSLGQWKHSQLQSSLQEIRSNHQPLTFTVDSVAIISRKGPVQPFKLRYEVPLGGGQPKEWNVPYVATVGPGVATARPQTEKYGLGGEAEGVWYFAYGANMSPKKLTGSRGITPLESVATTLPGWALAFNHRGAMGNIVQLEEGAKGLGGFKEVHGVAHRLDAKDFAVLTCMEHEYRPTEVSIRRSDGQGNITAVAFISAEDRLIRSGLPPTIRYADLLRTGADEFRLDGKFRSWLHSIPTVSSETKRGDEYWTGLEGEALKMYPRIWKGSEQSGGGRGRGRGGRGGRKGGRGGRGRGEGRGAPPQPSQSKTAARAS